MLLITSTDNWFLDPSSSHHLKTILEMILIAKIKRTWRSRIIKTHIFFICTIYCMKYLQYWVLNILSAVDRWNSLWFTSRHRYGIATTQNNWYHLFSISIILPPHSYWRSFSLQFTLKMIEKSHFKIWKNKNRFTRGQVLGYCCKIQILFIIIILGRFS